MSSEIIQILQVGAVGNPDVSEQRLLPYLTIDCSNSPEIEQLIELHRDTSAGDVICTWCWRPLSRSNVYLKVEFTRPLSAIAHLEFPVAEKGYVVDWIIAVKGFYLQSSKHGHVASVGFGRPAIVVEVPSSATFPIWRSLYQRALTKRFKKNGFRGKELDKAIIGYKSVQRQIWFRQSLFESGV